MEEENIEHSCYSSAVILLNCPVFTVKIESLIWPEPISSPLISLSFLQLNDSHAGGQRLLQSVYGKVLHRRPQCRTSGQSGCPVSRPYSSFCTKTSPSTLCSTQRHEWWVPICLIQLWRYLRLKLKGNRFSLITVVRTDLCLVFFSVAVQNFKKHCQY